MARADISCVLNGARCYLTCVQVPVSHDVVVEVIREVEKIIYREVKVCSYVSVCVSYSKWDKSSHYLLCHP